MTADWTRLAASVDALRASAFRLHESGNLVRAAVQRWCADADAVRFHLDQPPAPPLLIGILGGTGTGKSTLANRLVEAVVSGTSFRRTFTGGPIALAGPAGRLPAGWLGVPHEPAVQLPAKGRPGVLTLATASHPLLASAVLLDTPDLDGDAPAHAAEADRVFRWTQAAVFVVTPEKYQRPELLPYYRLARRYEVPALFVLNKCEEGAVLEDYRQELTRLAWAQAPVYAVPRDDAAYEPPAGAGLADLREALAGLPLRPNSVPVGGLKRRCEDLLGRFLDQVLAPICDQRRSADQVLETLRRLRTPTGALDVSPLTQQLQRRMQEQSVLYLMGPGRVLDRVRSLPGLLARLPRTAWDLVRGGEQPSAAPALPSPRAPDFTTLLAEQLTIVQSRIDDLLRTSGLAACVDQDAAGYAAARIDPREAGRIAEEELAALQQWLEQHWNEAPRDTRVIQKVLKVLPGGAQLTRWSEAAPYLLAIIVATHHAFFGPIDLLILGSFSLAAWLGEKASNEVASRTKQANRRMSERFEALAQEQVQRVAAWIERQVPSDRELRALESAADRLGALLAD